MQCFCSVPGTISHFIHIVRERHRIVIEGRHEKDESINHCFFVFFQGVIIRYELFMQALNESSGNVTNPSMEHRIFLSSGWLDPQQPLDSASENALTPPESSVVVSDLEPFTAYRFRVLTVNMAGSTMSEWSTARTAEGG